MRYLLDTNIVSAAVNSLADIKKRLYDLSCKQEDEIFVSVITHYEIRRGLLAAGAMRKMEIFEEICRQFVILWIDNIDLSEKAAEIHTELKKQGRPIPDNDILTAATAFCHDLTLVTNDRHFSHISEIRTENWLAD